VGRPRLPARRDALTNRRLEPRPLGWRNIEQNPWVEVVIDHYEEDWTKLSWVRLRAAALA
jgi:hypothetical protein